MVRFRRKSACAALLPLLLLAGEARAYIGQQGAVVKPAPAATNPTGVQRIAATGTIPGAGSNNPLIDPRYTQDYTIARVPGSSQNNGVSTGTSGTTNQRATSLRQRVIVDVLKIFTGGNFFGDLLGAAFDIFAYGPLNALLARYGTELPRGSTMLAGLADRNQKKKTTAEERATTTRGAVCLDCSPTAPLQQVLKPVTNTLQQVSDAISGS
jgi:hypothetical protein